MVGEAGCEVADLDRVARVIFERRDDDRAVAVVALRVAPAPEELDREHAVVAALVEERREGRIAVETREAGPHEAPVRIEETAPGSVSERGEVEVGRRHLHRDSDGSGSLRARFGRSRRQPRLRCTGERVTLRGMAAAPLVVLSNRLPITLRRERGKLRADPSAGGLVSALTPALHSRGGHLDRVGPGAKLHKGEALADRIDPAKIELVPVAREPDRGEALLPRASRTARFGRSSTHSPSAPSSTGASGTRTRRSTSVSPKPPNEGCREGHLVWIHDYHLMRTAAPLRERYPDARLAFFLHIPFPPFDVFRILPVVARTPRGAALACRPDRLPQSRVRHELSRMRRASPRSPGRPARRTGRGRESARSAPGRFRWGSTTAPTKKRAHGAARKRPRERVVLGVDRLDYTKGIPERLRAFERFLENHPEHREKVSLIQLAVPSRGQMTAYQEQKREIDELVGRVNGRFGTSTLDARSATSTARSPPSVSPHSTATPTWLS